MTEKNEKKEKKGDTVDKAIKDFYEDYGITSNNNKDLKNQELFNLYKIPKKDKELNQTHFQNYEPMKVQQADILYLPEDKGYKYALVVTDIGTRLTDAKPLKSKSSTEVVKAFENIYSGNILKKPKKIESDQGTEFKGELTKYLKKNNIYIRYGKTNRHKQQAIVERKNQTIGTALSKRMQAQELLTNEVSTEWKDDLPKVINAINRKAKKTKIKSLPDLPVSQGDSSNLLDIGEKVRVKLEAPLDYTSGKRLHGNFRSSDIRWDPKPRVVKEVLLKPGFPPMYLLDGEIGKRKVEPVAYTKNELQIIPENEESPKGEQVIRGKPKQFVINNIVDDKKIKNKKYFLVKWKGFNVSSNTWEPYEKIKKIHPELVKKYEQSLKDFEN